jgi:hypothetical protein
VEMISLLASPLVCVVRGVFRGVGIGLVRLRTQRQPIDGIRSHSVGE